jgi:hypothetical protein
VNTPDFNSSHGLARVQNQTFYCDNGGTPQTWTRIQVNTTNKSVVIDKVQVTGGALVWVTNTPRITLNLDDLDTFQAGGTLTEATDDVLSARMREIRFKDATDCLEYRLAVLATKPQLVT